jgi:hypothetical protein
MLVSNRLSNRPGVKATVVEAVVALTIIGAALFETQTLSERAFRFLRWIGNRPEPPTLAARPSKPERGNGLVTARGSGWAIRAGCLRRLLEARARRAGRGGR